MGRVDCVRTSSSVHPSIHSLYPHASVKAKCDVGVSTGVHRYFLLTALQTLYAYFVEGDTVFVGKRKTFSKRVRPSAPSPYPSNPYSPPPPFPISDHNRTPNPFLPHRTRQQTHPTRLRPLSNLRSILIRRQVPPLTWESERKPWVQCVL